MIQKEVLVASLKVCEQMGMTPEVASHIQRQADTIVSAYNAVKDQMDRFAKSVIAVAQDAVSDQNQPITNIQSDTDGPGEKVN